MTARSIWPVLLVAGCSVFAVAFSAESKVEAELRMQLASSEAARAAALKEKAALLANLATLTHQMSTHGAQRVIAEKNASQAVIDAASSAAANAAAADAIAKANAASAERAVRDAEIERQTLEHASSSSTTAIMVTQLAGFMAMLVGLLYKAWTDTRDRRWAHEDIKAHNEAMMAGLREVKAESHDTAQTITILEKNTNSIKDALVKTTGEAEKAKGVLQEKARHRDECAEVAKPPHAYDP